VRKHRRHKHRSASTRALLGALCLLAIGGSACGPPTSTPTPPAPSSAQPTASTRSASAPARTYAACPGAGRAAVGVFRETNPAELDAFEAWLGCRVDYAIDYSSRSSWADIQDPSYLHQAWAGEDRRLVLGVAMLPEEDDSATIGAGAAGDYDGYYKTLAERLVADGEQDAILRVGWEFNLSESRWFTRNTDDFIKYWRNIANVMNAVPGSRFLFDWNVNNGRGPVDAKRYYPGDDVVDIIGVDAYDVSGRSYPYPKSCDAGCRSTRQTKAWDEEIFGGTNGLSSWRTFAADHRKPMSLPEWGLWGRPDGTGGADDPAYVRRMHEFIVDPASNMAYQSYFEFDGDDGQHRLMTTYPEAGVVFRQLFAARSTPTATPS
jgi:hypothetical protein